MFLYDGATLTPFRTELDAVLTASQLYRGTPLADGMLRAHDDRQRPGDHRPAGPRRDARQPRQRPAVRRRVLRDARQGGRRLAGARFRAGAPRGPLARLVLRPAGGFAEPAVRHGPRRWPPLRRRADRRLLPRTGRPWRGDRHGSSRSASTARNAGCSARCRRPTPAGPAAADRRVQRGALRDRRDHGARRSTPRWTARSARPSRCRRKSIPPACGWACSTASRRSGDVAGSGYPRAAWTGSPSRSGRCSRTRMARCGRARPTTARSS